MAAEQWGCSGRINYCAEARDIISGILASEIGPTSRLPMLGDWTDPDGERFHQFTPRLSDVMPDHFRAFFRATGNPVWDEVVTESLNAVGMLQSTYAATTGLVPDFAVPAEEEGMLLQPAPPNFLEGPHDGHYYYNSGRVPWRIATDALINGSSASTVQVRVLSGWVRHETNGNPYKIRAGYILDGTPIGGYFTSFFAAPLGVAAMLDPDGQAWLNTIYEAVRNSGEGYYADSVTLLCLLVMTGNYWDPTTIPPTVAPPRRVSGRRRP